MPFGKSKAAKPILPGIGAPGSPPEPAGNHQVDDQEKVVVEGENDPLAQAPESSNVAAGELVRTRVDRANDERVAEASPLELLSRQSRRQRQCRRPHPAVQALENLAQNCI